MLYISIYNIYVSLYVTYKLIDYIDYIYIYIKFTP